MPKQKRQSECVVRMTPSATFLRSDSPFFEGLKAGLARVSPLSKRSETKEYFGLLRGSEDLATLVKLRGTGKPTRETQERVNRFLEGQARLALGRVKRWLGLRRGRPRDFDKRSTWAICAELRRRDPKKYSWRKLASIQAPNEYANDPRLAMDRVRHGVGAVLKERHIKSKPS
jgi:hypothetical protein